MERKTLFSQLWREEIQYLCEQASLLDESSVIVEIGTGQGGAAYLFATSVKEKNISIYSYDISPSDEACENLKGLNVNIIAKPSVEGAKDWSKEYAKPVDLLFIDGSHSLENVYLDLISWLPYVRAGGRILFHDFDPLYRSGSAHLGVKVIIDALINADVFLDVKCVGRIFSGIKKKEIHSENLIKGCFCAWRDIDKKFEKFKKLDFSHYDFIGDDRDYLMILKELWGLGGQKIEDLNNIISRNNVLVLPLPLSNDITNRIAGKSKFVFLEELIFFYLLYDSIMNNKNEILKIVQDRKSYFKWEELLEMHNHSHNCDGSISSIFNIKDKSIESLSRVCARELLRINIVKNIFFAITGKF